MPLRLYPIYSNLIHHVLDFYVGYLSPFRLYMLCDRFLRADGDLEYNME
jgi:hypothetical protein